MTYHGGARLLSSGMFARGSWIGCSWIAWLGGLALAGAAAPVAEGAPPGRVIRVERARAVVAPRFCVQPAGGQRVCFGRPREGEHIALIDAENKMIRGDFVIDTIADATEMGARGLCVDSGAFAVRGHLLRGDADPDVDLIGLRGLVLGARAQVLDGVDAPSGRPEETVDLALDTDGDGRADVVVTRFPCDAAGAMDLAADGRCFDIHVEERGRLRRTSRDILKVCR